MTTNRLPDERTLPGEKPVVDTAESSGNGSGSSFSLLSVPSSNSGSQALATPQYTPQQLAAYWSIIMSMHPFPTSLRPSTHSGQFPSGSGSRVASYSPYYHNLKVTYSNSSSVNYLRFKWDEKIRDWVVSSTDFFTYVYPCKLSNRGRHLQRAGFKDYQKTLFDKVQRLKSNQPNIPLKANDLSLLITSLSGKKGGWEWDVNLAGIKDQLLVCAVDSPGAAKLKDSVKSAASWKAGLQEMEIKQIRLQYDPVNDIVAKSHKRHDKKTKPAGSSEEKFPSSAKSKEDDFKSVSSASLSTRSAASSSSPVDSLSSQASIMQQLPAVAAPAQRPEDLGLSGMDSSSISQKDQNAVKADEVVVTPRVSASQLLAPMFSHQEFFSRVPRASAEASVVPEIMVATDSVGEENGDLFSETSDLNPRVTDWRIERFLEDPLRSILDTGDDEQNEEYSSLGKRIREEDDAEPSSPNCKRQKM